MGILTGHCHLNKHLHRIGIKPDSRCRLCEVEEESAEHILLDCEALALSRLITLGLPGEEESTIRNDPIKKTLEFIRKTGVYDWE